MPENDSRIETLWVPPCAPLAMPKQAIENLDLAAVLLARLDRLARAICPAGRDARGRSS